MSGAGDGFRQLRERRLHDGPVVSLATGTFVGPDGATFEREIVRHPGAVSVVPLVDEHRAVLVRQYRGALGDVLLEIPAGKRDVAGEDPEVGARRELREEVGVHDARLEEVATFYNSPGFCDEWSIVYLAWDLRFGASDRHGIEEEHLEVVEVQLADVAAMIASGELCDAKTVIGLLLACRRVGI